MLFYKVSIAYNMEYRLQTSAILYDKNLQQVDIIYRVNTIFQPKKKKKF